MSVKLSKATRDLNVGLSTLVEFLAKKGIKVENESNPNTRISDEHYELLYKEFAKDQSQKKESDDLAKRNKDKPKSESVSIEPEKNESAKEIAIEIPQSDRPKFKAVGKIDLDSLNKPSKQKTDEKLVSKNVEQVNELVQEVVAAPKVEPVLPEPVKVEAPKAEEKSAVKVEEIPAKAENENKIIETVEKKSEKQVVVKPVIEKQVVVQPVVNKTQTEEVKQNNSEEVFKLRTPTVTNTPNVVGKIDLDALNQKTRPNKKSKEERRKERDEKHSANKPNNNGANANKGQANSDEKKKRTRIQKEKVDINKPFDGNRQGGQNQGQNQGGQNQQNRGKKNFKQNRDKRSFEHAQPSEEDVQKQVKETLALLTKKEKSKGAKYRNDKREAASHRQQQEAEKEMQDSKVIKITEFVTVNELATMMDVQVTKVIGTCMILGLMVSINQRLDAETINIVADEFGFKTEYVSADVAETVAEVVDKEEDLLPRAPIVTVMGHVDHGKTSLLDYIRKTNVIAGEAGGITQHIGAYNVQLEDGQKITFLDTPGHEAFTAMRARGAQITDIAIIIVAADDNIMPQTIEAIHHAAAANVPIVFAINKVDKPSANPDKIKEALANMNYLVEEWGGKYQSQDISAKQGTGIQELLEKVLLEAEMLELKANPNKNAVGSIIESSLDKGRGYLATVLVEGGTLKTGDIILSGIYNGRVKAMYNERNQRINEVKPGEPVLLLGLNGAPQAGERFNIFDTEQEAREIANKREQLQREQSIRTKKHLTLDELGRRIALGNFQELNIIIKGDVDGSIEALSDSLIKLSTAEIQVNVIHKAVGAISESDIMLAAASNAIICGFQVRPSLAARRLAEKEEIDIRLYSIIYDAIEEIKSAMEGMLSPEIKEEVTGMCEILSVFKISKVGTIAGCLVRDGKVKRTSKVRLIRDGIVVYSGELASLKRMKDDVKEVTNGFECGLNIDKYNDIREGDFIEAFEEVEVKKTF